MYFHYMLILLLSAGTWTTVDNEGTEPVSWSFDASKVGASEYELVLTAQVEPGWYIYSQHQESDEGPIPTSFNFEDEEEYELVGEVEEVGDKKEGYDEIFDMNIRKFSGEVRFIQRIRLLEPVGSIEGWLEYMACDDKRCLPPRDVSFSIDLP
ncbi:MAG: protein-disulfide reductase DsbD family protein [Saprospiraceae bacterium]|nr:protein-disulfide reductase DsbD family protein [Saprospiraceae bacterium]